MLQHTGRPDFCARLRSKRGRGAIAGTGQPTPSDSLTAAGSPTQDRARYFQLVQRIKLVFGRRHHLLLLPLLQLLGRRHHRERHRRRGALRLALLCRLRGEGAAVLSVSFLRRGGRKQGPAGGRASTTLNPFHKRRHPWDTNVRASRGLKRWRVRRRRQHQITMPLTRPATT